MGDMHAVRIEMIRESLPEWQVEGLLVSSPTNCRWLSGFTGSAAALLITNDKALLATDSRYWIQAADQAPNFQLFKHFRRSQDSADFVQSAQASTIGFEANYTTVAEAALQEKVEGVTWIPLTETIEPFRKTKSEDEIAAIGAAAAITDTAIAALPQFIRPGISERELAWQLERHMRDGGADGMAFDPIVAFGPHSARPHHAPGDRRLRPNEIILIDMGAKLNGYNSDLTRTFFFGDPPDSQFEEVYAAVSTALTNALEQIRPQTTTQEAHKIAADAIAVAGYSDYFGHGLGHGVGLEIHEAPFMSPIRPPSLLGSTVITIEPGIYIPNWGGVRLEDLIILTGHGIENLSHAPKDPWLPIT